MISCFCVTVVTPSCCWFWGIYIFLSHVYCNDDIVLSNNVKLKISLCISPSLVEIGHAVFAAEEKRTASPILSLKEKDK